VSELMTALTELRAKSVSQNERLAQRVLLESKLGVSIGADPDGSSSLAFRIDDAIGIQFGELQDSEGLSFHWSDQDYGPGRWLAMNASQQEDAEIFAHICSDLESHILADDAVQAAKGVGTRIRMWQRFLAVGRRGLGPRQQLGLWGELRVLLILANATSWKRALEGWVGPGGASQDFRLGTWAAEVKTTSSSSDAIAISSLDQLDTETHREIHLVHIGAEELSPTLGQPLPDLVGLIRAQVQGQTQLLSDLENRLLASGYHAMHEARYSRHGFLARTCVSYRVTDGFPRLVRSSLPSSIKEARYTLQTKDLAAFASSAEELPRELRALLGGI